MRQDEKVFTEGSDNVFADFGVNNHDEAQLKSRLALRLYKAIQDKGLTQRQAAEILCVDRAKVSAIINGRLKGYSIERLFRFLNALDVNIEISFDATPTRQHDAKTRVV